MAKEPKINCTEVNTRLNGTYSGSDDNFYFWEETIQSGSLWDIISGSSTQLRVLVGNSVMDNTNTDVIRQVKEAELLTACFNTLVLLSGNVIVSGFDWQAGVKVSQHAMLPAYKNLIDGFKKAAQNAIRSLQTPYYMEDWESPSWDKTASAVMP